METDFMNADKIHFIGIGGIGVSALARMAIHEGKQVSGSDASESPIVDTMKQEGASVAVGHHADNLPDDADLVVYSIAVPPENPERRKAQELEIPSITYPEALGELSKAKNTIAIAGTHGKTTTTAMLSEIAKHTSLLYPTVIVGSLLNGSASNFLHGRDNNLIVEACEYKRSFLKLHPDILIITNIDNDHLDYFDDMEDIKHAFTQAIERVPDDGVVITNANDEHVQSVIEETDSKVVDYTRISTDFNLTVPGEHNIANAQAAIAAATELGVPQPQASEYIQHFSGTWRRAEAKGGTPEGAEVIDDYAHHPTEIKTTLQGLKLQHPEKKMVVVFQPHLYSRTKKLLDAFPESFTAAERIVVLPIYAAREAPDPNISAEDLTAALADNLEDTEVVYADDFDAAKDELKGYTTENNLIVTMGAGDVYELADTLVDNT